MDDLRAELSKQFPWTLSTMLGLLGMMLTVGAGVATALFSSNPESGIPNPEWQSRSFVHRRRPVDDDGQRCGSTHCAA